MIYKKNTVKAGALKTPGEFMRYNRERKRFTQGELAKASGVSVCTICNWEKDVHLPRLDQLELVADTLGLSIDEYVGHEEKRSRI